MREPAEPVDPLSPLNTNKSPVWDAYSKYQLPAPYGFRDTAWTRYYRSLWQGQRSNQGPYQVSTSYTLRCSRYNLDKILKLMIATTRSKVKSKSHHNVAHLHPLTYVPTKYQLPAHCYSF